jgi:hypothetical protein
MSPDLDIILFVRGLAGAIKFSPKIRACFA